MNELEFIFMWMVIFARNNRTVPFLRYVPGRIILAANDLYSRYPALSIEEKVHFIQEFSASVLVVDFQSKTEMPVQSQLETEELDFINSMFQEGKLRHAT